MSWKGAIVATLLTAYAATWLFGVPQIRRDFKKSFIEYRFELFAKESPLLANTTPEERSRVADSAQLWVDWALPVLPGVILVSHSESTFGCGTSGLVLALWYPGHTRILRDNG